MEIEVSSDAHINSSASHIDEVRSVVEGTLERFSTRITRVEVHFGDESAGRSTVGDKRCTMEVRPAGQPPVAVTSHADSVDDALRQALDKATRVLSGKFDRHP